MILPNNLSPYFNQSISNNHFQSAYSKYDSPRKDKNLSFVDLKSQEFKSIPHTLNKTNEALNKKDNDKNRTVESDNSAMVPRPPDNCCGMLANAGNSHDDSGEPMDLSPEDICQCMSASDERNSNMEKNMIKSSERENENLQEIKEGDNIQISGRMDNIKKKKKKSQQYNTNNKKYMQKYKSNKKNIPVQKYNKKIDNLKTNIEKNRKQFSMAKEKMDHSDNELSDLQERFHRICYDYDYPPKTKPRENTRNGETMNMSNFTQEHSQKENKDERISFICTICETSFKRKNSLSRHMRNIHQEFFTDWDRKNKRKNKREHFTQNKKIKIMDDDDKLTDDYNLSPMSAVRKKMINFVGEHSRKENKEERDLFICTICNTTFKRLNSLTRHNRNIHEEFFSDRDRKNK